MPDPKEILQDRLMSLRQEYIDNVNDKINAIMKTWDKARSGNSKSDEFYELVSQVHSLYSSGTTFGLSPLSEIAHKMDALIKTIYEKGDTPSEEHCAQIDIMIQRLEETTVDEKLTDEKKRKNLWNPAKNVLIPLSDSKTIFVVDDDKILAKQVATILESNGYKVQIFNQLQDVKENIIKTKPSAIIMDMVFPEGDLSGANFLLNINHRINIDIPVIFISVHDDINARLQSVRTGSFHFFSKPLNFEKLLAAVDDVTTERKANPYRVLIIDDDKPLSEFYALVLKQAGISTAIVNNPFEALDVINEIHPELILLDINMPECSGLELASIIRQQEKFTGISIVFLSVEKGFDRQLAAMDMGGDDYLSKPIDPDYLVATVTSRVHRARILNNMATNLLSAMRELENQHSALDKHAIVSITDVDGMITYVNDKFCEISGYSRDELINDNHSILKSDFHVNDFYNEIWTTLNNKKVWQGEICNRKKNGELYWVYTTIVPFMDERQIPYQYVSVHNEITSRVLAEKSLMDARDSAVNASQAKSDFISRVSHELRTPLNAILGFTQLLESMTDQPLTTKQMEFSDEIRRAGSHLLTLINELLDLSRIEAGQLKIDMISVPLCTILNECCSLVSPLASERGIVISKNYDHMKHTLVSADPVRLKQVIVNLLSNAIKYNDETGNIVVQCQPDNNGCVVIEVINTGSGIPDDQLGKLFQPFSRLPMHEDQEGTGIGLVLSKRLVELMGGKIGVNSNLDDGTHFWIEIKKESVESEIIDSDEFQTESEIQNFNSKKPYTVLYVEDNKANFKLVEEILNRRPKINLLHAVSAEAGLKMAKDNHPDIILMDLQLPGMNGYEGLEAIRTNANLREIPAIAITSIASSDGIQRAIDAGFEDYITKPINITKFLHIIDLITEKTIA